MNLGIETHYNYFAPRTGLAYRVNEKTVVRAGFGVSYVPPQVATGLQSFNYPVRANNAFLPLNNNPYGVAVLPDGQAATFQIGFPAPVPVPIPATGIVANPDPASVYTVTPLDFKSPHVNAWNLAVQRSLPLDLAMDITYLGSHGVNIFVRQNLNAGQVLGAGARGQPYYPRTASMTQLYRGTSSSYNALQVKLDRRFSGGLSLTTSITWQKAMTFHSGSTGDGALRFHIDQRRNYARADFDQTFNFVQGYVYELPLGRGKRWLSGGPASAVLGGWQLSGILTLRTGTPLTFTANAAGLNAPGNTQTPNLIAPIRVLHGISVSNPWFDPASFAQPTGAVFGNLGRSVISGPGMGRLDLSLFKKIQATEKIRLELRGESYNLTNTPAFANPNTSLTNATFGRVTSTIGTGAGVSSTGGGRWVRLGAKIEF